MKKQALLLLVLTTSWSLLARSQESVSTLSMDAQTTEKKSPLHLTMSLSSSSNLYKEDSPDREASTELLIHPSLELSEKTSLHLAGSLSHGETGPRDTEISNTTLSLKSKGPLLGVFESTGLIGAIAPTNEVDRQQNRFQGAGVIVGSLKYDWHQLQVIYSLFLRRNFHEFNINADGSPNIQHSLTNGLSLEWELNPKWSLSAGGLYRQGWTYRNFERQGFEAEVGVNYSLAKAWQISAGVSNAGNAFKANGQDSNIKLYDENTSAIRATVTFVN